MTWDDIIQVVSVHDEKEKSRTELLFKNLADGEETSEGDHKP